MPVLTSVCGCSLVIEAGERPLIRLSGGGVALTHALSEGALLGLEGLADYLQSCVLAAVDDQEQGVRHESLCDLQYREPLLDLDTAVEDLGNGVLRLKCTLVLPEEAPLDICHASVVLDVSLPQVSEFVHQVVSLLDTPPYWWVA